MFRIHFKGEKRPLTVVATRVAKDNDVYFFVYDPDATRFGMNRWRWILADNTVLVEEGE